MTDLDMAQVEDGPLARLVDNGDGSARLENRAAVDTDLTQEDDGSLAMANDDDVPNPRKRRRASGRAKKTKRRKTDSVLCPWPGCGKSLSSYLERHIATVHRGERSFKCEQCGQAFGHKHVLDRHILTVHEDERSFECEHCKQAFGHKFVLDTHIRFVHLGKRPFECEQCKKAFGQKQDLVKHVRTVHEGERSFQCEQCKQAFGQKRSLERHVRTVHQSERPFECEQCHRKFGQKPHLDRHVQAVHEGKRPFSCEQCDHAASTKQNLDSHFLAMHTEEGQARQKKSENMLANDLKAMGIAFKREQRIDLSAIGGTFRRVDFKIERLTHLVFGENNEDQHDGIGYSVRCEMKRIADIVAGVRLAGETRPIKFVMFNPGAVAVDGSQVRLTRQRRLPALQTEIDTPPEGQLGVSWICYDETDQEPDIFSDPDFDETIRSCSTSVGASELLVD